MKKTVKTEEVLKIYNIINVAKYGKMDDADKVKVWKIARKTKPIATKFEEDLKDAAEKMKPGNEFDANLQKAQEYERLKQEGKDPSSAMSDSDYKKFVEEFKEYQKLIDKAVKEFANKEVEIEFDTISEDAFGKLMASNEWDMNQATTLGDMIVE